MKVKQTQMNKWLEQDDFKKFYLCFRKVDLK